MEGLKKTSRRKILLTKNFLDSGFWNFFLSFIIAFFNFPFLICFFHRNENHHYCNTNLFHSFIITIIVFSSLFLSWWWWSSSYATSCNVYDDCHILFPLFIIFFSFFFNLNQCFPEEIKICNVFCFTKLELSLVLLPQISKITYDVQYRVKNFRDIL